MKTLCVFLVIVIITENILCLSFNPRRKRQSPQDEDNSLDDRYGRDRPQNRPWDQGQPNQGRPWNQIRPNQGTDGNWQRPNQGNNWQDPNQGEAPWMRPDQGQDQWDQDQWSDPSRPNQNQPQPTTPRATGGTTTQSAALRACIRNCPVTPEYNPVCGSNGQTYTNPGGLTCAQACGVNVSLQRSSPCPTSTTTGVPST